MLGSFSPLQFSWPTHQSRAGSWHVAAGCGRTGDTGTPSVTHTSSQICSTSKHRTHLNPVQVFPRQARPVLSCPTGVQAGNPLSAKERQQELRQRLPSLLLLSLPLISSPHQVITQLTCGWWDGRKRGVWGGSTFSPAPLHHKPLQTLNRGPDRKARKESNHCQAG